MKSDFHGLLSWPLVFAILFIAIPPLLFYSHPSSFWANTDYEPLGLADALNLAYRIADFRIYPAVGMADHPGVPFYLMSWRPGTGRIPGCIRRSGFFSAVIDHVEDYHQASVWLGALAGAAGVYILARTARPLAPVGVVAIGLLAWLISTPAALLMFTTPSIELFAILVNGLFFYALVRIAFDRDFSRSVTVLAASVSAFAYLNKLPYINVSLALAAAGICSLVFGGAGLALARQRCVLFTLSSLGIILAVGCLVIGWGEFLHLLTFHRSIVFHSGLYGTGDRFVVSGNDVWHAVAAIPQDRTYAMLIAPILGGAVAIGGFFTARRGAQHLPVAIIAIGAGLASLASAIFVLKHYDLHYTAGVSATLPASAVAGYLLVNSSSVRLGTAAAALATAVILLMAYETVPSLISVLAARTHVSALAAADFADIDAQRARDPRPIAFLYKAPFAGYGEGFVISNAGVPRLKDEYLASHRDMFSASNAGMAGRQAGAYVVDKSYFPTAESVRAAPNLTLLEPLPVRFENGDRLIELRTAFVLVRPGAAGKDQTSARPTNSPLRGPPWMS